MFSSVSVCAALWRWDLSSPQCLARFLYRIGPLLLPVDFMWKLDSSIMFKKIKIFSDWIYFIPRLLARYSRLARILQGCTNRCVTGEWTRRACGGSSVSLSGIPEGGGVEPFSPLAPQQGSQGCLTQELHHKEMAPSNLFPFSLHQPPQSWHHLHSKGIPWTLALP